MKCGPPDQLNFHCGFSGVVSSINVKIYVCKMCMTSTGNSLLFEVSLALSVSIYVCVCIYMSVRTRKTNRQLLKSYSYRQNFILRKVDMFGFRVFP